MHTYIFTHIRTGAHTYTNACLDMVRHVCEYVYVFMCIYTYKRVCVKFICSMYVLVFVCMQACMWARMHAHI